MKKHMKFIVAIAALLCVGIAVMLTYFLNINLNKITQQRGYTITSQIKKSIKITIDKKELPPKIDFAQGISFVKDDVILYQTDTSTMYLKSINYANSDTKYLSFTFDIYYNLPQEGTIVVPYNLEINNNTTSYTYDVTPHSEQVKDISRVFDNAISLHGTGPSEQFSIYLKTDVFTEAKDEISFIIDGFNELSYIRK